ncbi:MAG: SAM-dependent chlorinase/fluorinase [Alphaproteobacteria bacterium]|nr:SAM-dependent chlorinase/fluorinase [Alphaproteobacteria bacterium]
MILLFSDFGYSGPYAGQMRTALLAQDPDAAIVDLMHDAPRCDPKAAAYLLAALAGRMPAECVCLAVVDPGVGGDRTPLIVKAGRRFFVGPGNGLFEILGRRAGNARGWRIDWRPEGMSDSFHGRDLFAPVAAMLGKGAFPQAAEVGSDGAGATWPDDLPEAIYTDGFGNVMSGLRASLMGEEARIAVAGRQLRRARIFSDVAAGEAFWYENSIGLVEIAVNRGSAADILDLKPGDPVGPAP